jgi:hypothetical protein
LLRMTLSKPNVPYLLVERSKLVQKLRREVECDEFYTMVLHGNRGCGKTNLLRLALEGRGGVLELRVCTPQDVDNFCKPRAWQLAAKLGISGRACSSYDHNKNATKALKTFRKIHEKKAVIVISVDETCTGVMLTAVLQECKRLGRDKYESHVQIIVDLSAVFAVHQTTFSLETELIAESFHVPDPSGEEVKLHLQRAIQKSAHGINREDAVQLAAKMTDGIGGNFADLLSLVGLLGHGAFGSNSKKEVEKNIDNIVAAERRYAKSSLDLFFLELAQTGRPQTQPKLLKKAFQPYIESMLPRVSFSDLFDSTSAVTLKQIAIPKDILSHVDSWLVGGPPESVYVHDILRNSYGGFISSKEFLCALSSCKRQPFSFCSDHGVKVSLLNPCQQYAARALLAEL